MTVMPSLNTGNAGLSMYNQSYDTLGALDLSAFTVLSGAIYANMVAEAGWWEAAQLGLFRDTIPDMLRSYMADVRTNRKSYSPADLDSYWVPLLINQGFTPKDRIKNFFRAFNEIYKTGAVPRDIWYPDVNQEIPGVLPPGRPGAEKPIKDNNTKTLIVAGAALLGVGALGFLLLKD